MKDTTKAKLQIAGKTDKEIAAAEELVLALAKDFIAEKPWAKQWDQATHARFILWALGLDGAKGHDPADSEVSSMDPLARSIFALRVGNASAFRQDLESAKILLPSQDMGDYT